MVVKGFKIVQYLTRKIKTVAFEWDFNHIFLVFHLNIDIKSVSLAVFLFSFQKMIPIFLFLLFCFNFFVMLLICFCFCFFFLFWGWGVPYLPVVLNLDPSQIQDLHQIKRDVGPLSVVGKASKKFVYTESANDCRPRRMAVD